MKRNYNLLVQKLKPFKVKLKPDQPVVAVSEEFGYREYIWLPNMSCREFEMWWRRQRDLTKFNALYLMKQHGAVICDKSYSISVDTTDEDEYFYYTCGNSRAFHVYHNLKDSGMVYFAHIFCNDHSWLKTPGGVYIHHATYHEACLQTERDIQSYSMVRVAGEYYWPKYEKLGNEIMASVTVKDLKNPIIGFGATEEEALKDARLIAKGYEALCGDPMETWTRWTTPKSEV